MAVESLSDTYWATSEEVRETMEVPTNQGVPVDVDKRIESATDTVQTWWQEATGLNYPEELPDPGTLEDENPLLVRAVEYLAASEYHEIKAEAVRADDGTPRHVFLEERAHSKFDDWVQRNGYDDDSVDDERAPPTSSLGGVSSSLVDLGDDAGGGH
jgi:hypothetical protein